MLLARQSRSPEELGMSKRPRFARPSEPLRVVIADDHRFYRESLARLLRGIGIEVVREVRDGDGAVRAVDATEPDVVVMDLKLPGLSGLDATRRLAERMAPTPVLMVSVSAREADLTDALLAGANGYVRKDRPVEELIAGIRAAAAGQALIPAPTGTLLRPIRNLRR
jgi:DNA-binding NarL/FixJ family response regulator